MELHTLPVDIWSILLNILGSGDGYDILRLYETGSFGIRQIIQKYLRSFTLHFANSLLNKRQRFPHFLLSRCTGLVTVSFQGVWEESFTLILPSCVETLHLEIRGVDIKPSIVTPTAFLKHALYTRTTVSCKVKLIAPNLKHLYCDHDFKLSKRSQIPTLDILCGNTNIAMAHLPKTKLIINKFQHRQHVLLSAIPQTLNHLEFTVGLHDIINIRPNELPMSLNTLVIPSMWKLQIDDEIPTVISSGNGSSHSLLPSTLTRVSNVSCSIALKHVL